jgi:hypothetical protein
VPVSGGIVRRYIVGVDPGKIHDPTGIVAVLVDDHMVDGRPQPFAADPYYRAPRYIDHAGRPVRGETTPSATTFDIMHVERRPLDEPYTSMVRYVAQLMTRPPLTIGGVPPEAIFDVTGVGQGVADIAREAGIAPRLVSITSGTRATLARGYWRVPKADLVTAVMIAMQGARVKLAEGGSADGATLVRELQNFRVVTTAAGNDSYGAADDWRQANHDDLVLALAIAVWWGSRPARRVYQPGDYRHLTR